MKQSDKSISNQLEWTQAALDAVTALRPDTRDRLASLREFIASGDTFKEQTAEA